MVIGGVLTGLLVLGLFFTMLSSSPRREEPVAQSTAIKNERT
jgi:hypothetical protein